MSQKTENITKASQCADLLTEDIRASYRDSEGNIALELVLFDLLGDAMKIRNRLEELRKGYSK